MAKCLQSSDINKRFCLILSLNQFYVWCVLDSGKFEPHTQDLEMPKDRYKKKVRGLVRISGSEIARLLGRCILWNILKLRPSFETEVHFLNLKQKLTL